MTIEQFAAISACVVSVLGWAYSAGVLSAQVKAQGEAITEIRSLLYGALGIKKV